MYTVSKEFRFEAAHSLPQLPYESPCKRLHGHSYIVELHLSSKEVDTQGMVVDYNDMDDFGDYIKTYFDHQDLNGVVAFPTTAENIAKYLYTIAWKLWGHLDITVRVSETPKTWASYTEKA